MCTNSSYKERPFAGRPKTKGPPRWRSAIKQGCFHFDANGKGWEWKRKGDRSGEPPPPILEKIVERWRGRRKRRKFKVNGCLSSIQLATHQVAKRRRLFHSTFSKDNWALGYRSKEVTFDYIGATTEKFWILNRINWYLLRKLGNL